MLREGRGAFTPEAAEAEDVQVGVEPLHRVREQGPAGGPGDRVVETLVQDGEVPVGRVRSGGAGVGLHVLQDGLDGVELGLVGVAGGQGGGSRFQEQPHLEEFLHPLPGQQLGGPVAGQGALDDETVGLQPRQGLAHRGRGDVERAGPGPRCQRGHRGRSHGP